MKLLFSVNHPVQTFSVQGEITTQDSKVLRSSLMTFLESNPPYLVVDLSQATLMVPDAEIHSMLNDVRTVASAKNLSLVISQTDFETLHSAERVVDAALEKRARVLESKLELREQIKSQIYALKNENHQLRDRVKRVPRSQSPFSFFEKLWNPKS